MTISLSSDSMVFDFPVVDPAASLQVSFQRTLRVPDDGKQYGLPPGLGSFPPHPVEDLPADRVSDEWRRRGGVVMPMWQAEACWLDFSVWTRYPFLMKVGCGGINAVTGWPVHVGAGLRGRGLLRGAGPTVARGLLYRQGQGASVRRHAVAPRLHRRGAAHGQGRTRWYSAGRDPVEVGGVPGTRGGAAQSRRPATGTVRDDDGLTCALPACPMPELALASSLRKVRAGPSHSRSRPPSSRMKTGNWAARQGFPYTWPTAPHGSR